MVSKLTYQQVQAAQALAKEEYHMSVDFLNRLAQMLQFSQAHVKPDPAVEAVAVLLESDNGGMSRKIVQQIVAAVRAADKEKQ